MSEEECEMAWREYCKSGRKPGNIPENPDVVYKDEGWKAWQDWIGCYGQSILNNPGKGDCNETR